MFPSLPVELGLTYQSYCSSHIRHEHLALLVRAAEGAENGIDLDAGHVQREFIRGVGVWTILPHLFLTHGLDCI